jgi:NTE family protein
MLAAGLLLCACSFTIENAPINEPVRAAMWALPEAAVPRRDIVADSIVALTFSGGGIRAAAFSFGVLQALEAAKTPGGKGDLFDDVTFISSVSGGSLTAAYIGLHGRDGLATFRQQVLEQDIERGMRTTAFSPENLIRAFLGGINDRRHLSDWLDKNAFKGAKFADLYRRGKPDVWINATDLYNRTPFPFIPPLFAALCSDLASLSVAEAVTASMAVPLVFAPVLIRTYPEHCTDAVPPWVSAALADPTASKVLHASAIAVQNYRDSSRMRYVKLVDGGVTDNFGLTSILVARSASMSRVGPMTPRDAVRLKRMLFLVVDSGRGPSGDWALRPDGPSGVDLALSATDTAVDSAARVGYDAFRQSLREWHTQVVDFRCGLNEAQLRNLRGSLEGWDCRDITFDIGLISFADLAADRFKRLNEMPTRLTLPKDDVDTAITAGRDAALRNSALKQYMQHRGVIPREP